MCEGACEQGKPALDAEEMEIIIEDHKATKQKIVKNKSKPKRKINSKQNTNYSTMDYVNSISTKIYFNYVTGSTLTNNLLNYPTNTTFNNNLHLHLRHAAKKEAIVI